AGVIRSLRWLDVVGVDELFRGDGGQMQRAMSVVREALAIFEPCPRFLRCVAGIGGRGRVSLSKGCAHRPEADSACKSSVACDLKFAVPFFDRHPDFEMDHGNAGRLENAVDLAEGGEILDGSAAALRREGSGGNGFRGGDLRVGKRKAGESF